MSRIIFINELQLIYCRPAFGLNFCNLVLKFCFDFFLQYLEIEVKNPRTHIEKEKALYTDYEIELKVSLILVLFFAAD